MFWLCTEANNAKMTSLNLLGIEHEHIAQVSLNTILHMQAKVIMQDKEGQVGTSQAPKQSNNPPKKQAMKLDKGKDKVII